MHCHLGPYHAASTPFRLHFIMDVTALTAVSVLTMQPERRYRLHFIMDVTAVSVVISTAP
jgi:hypothetical protein